MDESLPVDSAFFAANMVALAIGGVSLLVFALVWCRIFKKAGHNAAMGLLMLVPAVNLVMMLVLAFSTWPVEREVKTLRGIKDAVRRADNQSLRRAA